MTISVLQDRQTSFGGASVSSIALAFSSSVTVGSALHGLGTSQAGTNTFSDNNTNTWGSTLDFIADTVGGVNIFQGVAQNAHAGATTVTISFGAANAFNGIWIREIGGAATTGNPDGHTSVFSTSTASQSISATNANQPALISVLSINSNSQETPSLDASLTASSANPGWDYATGNHGGVAGHKRIITTGSQSVTNTQASADALVTIMAIFLEAAGGGGGVTVALTGQAATFSAGSLAPSSSKALLGQGITSSTGSLVPSLSKALLGSSGTLTAGTLTPSTTIGLLGSLVTGTAGIVAASGGTGGNLTLALTGQRSAFAQGALGVSISVALAGASSTGAAGTLSPGTSAGLLGASSTTSTGTLGVGISPALVGTVLQGTPGTLQGGATFSLTGNLATFSLGILNPSLTVPLTGIFNSTNAGQLISSGGDIITTQTASMLLIRRGFRKKR